MKIKPFKAVFPKSDLIASPKSFFASIKYQYREYRSSGVYEHYDNEAFYIYQIRSEVGLHTGIVCSTSVNDLDSSKILAHEKTLAMKEQQMMHLLLKRKALVKPVLLGYKPHDELHKLILEKTKKDKPLIDIVFENDIEEHKLWPVKNKKLQEAISSSFSKLEKAYISDGHHRSATVSLLHASKHLGADAEKYNYLLTAYFPLDNLEICDYNRVVDISEIFSSSRFMAYLSKYFRIQPLKKEAKPNKKYQLTMFIDDEWYSLKWRKKYLSATDKSGVILDSALLDKYVFKNILKIEDVRTDTRIKYFGGTSPMEKLVRQTHKFNLGVAFCIYPISISELTVVADYHMTLPPKSTWFMPRLKSGIIAKDL